MTRSWLASKKLRIEKTTKRTEPGEIIGMNTIVISASVSSKPRTVITNEQGEYYWSMALWEPGARYPLEWKVLFPSGLFDAELQELSEQCWVTVVGYVKSWYGDDYIAKNGELTQKLVLIVNGTDLHVMRKRKKKAEKVDAHVVVE